MEILLQILLNIIQVYHQYLIMPLDIISKGSIVYNLDKFKSSKLENHQASKDLSSDKEKRQWEEAKQKKLKDIIQTLATSLNPFSCIDSIHNFTIIDQKVFVFTKQSLQDSGKKYGYYIQNQNQKDYTEKNKSEKNEQSKDQYEFIDSLKTFLDFNWNQCQKKLQHILQNASQNELKSFKKENKQIKVLMLGEEMHRFAFKNSKIQIQNHPCYFAFQYANTRLGVINQVKNKNQKIDFQKPYNFNSRYAIFKNQKQLSPKFFILDFTSKFTYSYQKENNPNNEIQNKDKQKQENKQWKQFLDNVCNKARQNQQLQKDYVQNTKKQMEQYGPFVKSCQYQGYDYKNIQLNLAATKFQCQLFINSQSSFWKTVPNVKNPTNLLKTFLFEVKSGFTEYPFKQPIMKRNKYIPKSSYSLAFQGGGAKGVAYIGAYKAIKQMKKDGKNIPITSIMGSSAGGIIALAVSTNIEPYQVEQICYKMKTIPQTDRIDRQYIKKKNNLTDKGINLKKKEIFQKIQQILVEYGIMSGQFIQKLIEFYKKDGIKLETQLQTIFSQLIKTFNPSLSQIFSNQNEHLTQLNLLGLLFEGALMTGQSIHDIGSECLVKYVLLNSQKFSKADTLSNIFTKQFSQEISKLVIEFPSKCENILNTPYSILINRGLSRVIIAIMNKFMILIEKLNPESFFITQEFVRSLNNWFTFYDQFEKKDVILTIKSLIQNHKKLHPKSDQISETQKLQKTSKVDIINRIIKQKKCISYKMLSEILDEEYLLNPNNFKPIGKIFEKSTIKQLLSSIFPQYCQKIGNDSKYIHNIAKDIADTFKEENLLTNLDFKYVSDYLGHYESLKRTVQKITLRQYYKLTQIELTCTSVDLDDKILRFFNHKTTPDLPVCRAVQMTGSFPVGFKAQLWRKEWGKYLVHYENVRRQVDITDHQFTDGGMLANFPIKYFDNDSIRDTYFYHVSCKTSSKYKTILLGFGLDKLEANSDNSSQKDLYEEVSSTGEYNKAKFKLKQFFKKFSKLGICDKLNGFFSVKSVASGQKQKQIYWKNINHNLLTQVPLIRFVFKLITSYPHADRNLNLECFQNSIVFTEFQQTEATRMEKVNEYIKDVKDEIKLKQFQIIEKVKPQKQENKVLQNKELNSMIDKEFQKSTTMNNLLNQAFNSFYNYRNKCLSQEQGQCCTQRANIIKKQFLNIIYYKLKIDLSKDQIEGQTLNFLKLKYLIYEQSNLSYEIGKRKINAHYKQEEYGQIQDQLGIQNFRKEIYYSPDQNKEAMKKRSACNQKLRKMSQSEKKRFYLT